MIKNIIVLSLLVASWAISAMENREFTELDCSIGVNSTCKGRYYDKKTRYNAVSLRDRGFWTFYDPLLVVDVDLSQDPLVYDEYNALKVHTCSVDVIKKETSFPKNNRHSHILIAKLEFNRQNKLPRRVFNTFSLLLTCALEAFEKQDKIYAWVNKEEKWLVQMLYKYCFKRSQEILFISDEKQQVLNFDWNTIQLEANTQDIYNALF